MKKQGFTLIELMVVIVIMGILAAVAVPKLFGMIAKSKASEVGPAAGTYVKLQQAFISETGSDYGNFKIIGYSAPGDKVSGGDKFDSKTTNFTYTDEGDYSEANTAALGNKTATWTAKNNVKLNDCAASTSSWTVSITKATDGAAAADAAVFTSEVAGDGCEELTPSFSKIGS